VSRIVPLSKNRIAIIDLLARAKRFHCPVTTAWQFDVDELNKARRDVQVNGHHLTMTACIIKATSLMLQAHPRFNHHLFTGLLGRYEVAFDQICCTLIILRRSANRERLLFPLRLENSDQLTVTEIQDIIDRHKYGTLENLEQFQAMERIKRMPRVAMSWFSYKSRSDYRFYRKYFGTYGISEMAIGSFGPRGGHVIANTAAAFVIGPLLDVPEVESERVVIKKKQGLTLISDHFVLDGVDILEGMRTLQKLLRNPSQLGLSTAEARLGA
jgi:pyruvate/2-oxoglutarate dehydrogenase complex dihydrolipoamide acyltransferase (E2) component